MSWLSEFLSASPKKRRKNPQETQFAKDAAEPQEEDEEGEETNLSMLLDTITGKHGAMPIQNLNSMAIKFILSKFLGAK